MKLLLILLSIGLSLIREPPPQLPALATGTPRGDLDFQCAKGSPGKAWDPPAQASPQTKMDWAVA